jgi:hypothetical protein
VPLWAAKEQIGFDPVVTEFSVPQGDDGLNKNGLFI